MKVLILTGRFGMGHYAVARTLVQEVQQAYPTASIVTEDIFEYMLSDGADRLYDAYTLLVNRGRALYRDYLYETVWGDDGTGCDTRTLDTHIARLRKKLGWTDKIETVYKIGYRLKKED